jgi:hypothetical protein
VVQDVDWGLLREVSTRSLRCRRVLGGMTPQS